MAMAGPPPSSGDRKERKEDGDEDRTRRFPIRSSHFLLPPFSGAQNTHVKREELDRPGARSEAVCIIGELSSRGDGGAFARPWLSRARALFSFPGGASFFLALPQWSVASRSLFALSHRVPGRPAAPSPVSRQRRGPWPAGRLIQRDGCRALRSVWFPCRPLPTDERLPERTVVTATQNI
ncbi:hypothetical protein PAHAL_5G510800 [Panicum hallii]|jgi:hypothetical protein|uniref:Uncharacterized protein n=1 Tax=Panicum hallii TaxID=206008 RepID=A0A2T8IP66_9POAL|nr:hypothetical protein PAHAL_5G510800 [Panicum hallii]